MQALPPLLLLPIAHHAIMETILHDVRPGPPGRYDKDDIPAKTMAEIRKKYVTDPRFTPEAAEKASKAAAGLCKWVYAMETYDRVAKVNGPLFISCHIWFIGTEK